MLSFPLVLLSLHALAVYSAPAKDSEGVAVFRRGGMIQGLTLRREEYHQLQKRDVLICGIRARDAGHNDCTKRYPSSLVKRMDDTQSSSSGGHDTSSPSQYTDVTSSSQQRQDEQDDDDMAEYEDEQAGGNHCDHLVELQVVGGVLNSHCRPQGATTGGISSTRANSIIAYLNNPRKNLYTIRADVNLAKGAATKRAILRLQDNRSLTYRSSFDQSAWAGVVKYLKSKQSEAGKVADWIQTEAGLNLAFSQAIKDVYTETLKVARAMRDSYVPSQQASQQTSNPGSSSPHSQGSSGSGSTLSDLPAESWETYNGRSVKVYTFNDGSEFYLHNNGQALEYVAYDQQNLYWYPPV